MATRFDANIIAAARHLHDERSDATSAGDGDLRFSSALLVTYQNRAIRDVVRDTYLKHLDKFRAVMPEMLKQSSAITPSYASSVGTVTLPADCWLVLEVTNSGLTLYYQPIFDDILRVLAGQNPLVVPSTTNPFWYQEQSNDIRVVKTLGPTSGTVYVYYLIQPSNMVAGAGQTTDIPLSPVWDGEIINRMVALASDAPPVNG